MNLELLRTFLEVERCRHFGRAADELYITQAAVSARIRQLETLLGTSLFDRAYRGIQLTPAGNRLLPHAEALIADWRKARQDVAVGGVHEQLSFGGSLRLWNVLLQDWLLRLRRARPDLAVIAESHTPDLLTRRVLAGVLDFAVMLEPAQLPTLEIHPLVGIELILVGSHPGQSVEGVLAKNYVYVDWGLAHAVEHRRLFPDAPEAQTRVSEAGMALALLEDIGGAAYLPRNMVGERLASGRLYTVAGAPAFDRTAYAVYPTRTERGGLIEACLELFSQNQAGR